jgi:hypothetical protein
VGPSVEVLAGQLRYLFEDQPELRSASVEQLTARLNHDDRFSRAWSKYPMATDSEIAERVGEFQDRITAADVQEARARVRADPYRD